MMNQDERLDRLIKYNFFGFQNTDLESLLCSKEVEEQSFINLKTFTETAIHPTTACFLGFLTCQDETYLMYAYTYDHLEYGFAWETFYDESHRDASILNDPPWFDFIEQGQMFKIKINPQKPVEHIVVERPFHEINNTVIHLGTNPCR